MEIYRDRLILYGCGDFLNDYEGIKGHEEYRDDLAVMYFADIDPSKGDLAGLEMVPLQIRRFSLARPSADDASWLARALDNESRKFGCEVLSGSDGRLRLRVIGTGAPEPVGLRPLSGRSRRRGS
jgi:poly-gamma-glutamate synthesis protein (capsule biosynthesis protein)